MDVLRQEIFLQKLATGMEKALKSTRFPVLLNMLIFCCIFKNFLSNVQSKKEGSRLRLTGDKPLSDLPFYFYLSASFFYFSSFYFYLFCFFAILLPLFQPPFKEKQWDHKDRDSSATNKVSFTRPCLLSV